MELLVDKALVVIGIIVMVSAVVSILYARYPKSRLLTIGVELFAIEGLALPVSAGAQVFWFILFATSLDSLLPQIASKFAGEVFYSSIMAIVAAGFIVAYFYGGVKLLFIFYREELQDASTR